MAAGLHGRWEPPCVRRALARKTCSISTHTQPQLRLAITVSWRLFAQCLAMIRRSRSPQRNPPPAICWVRQAALRRYSPWWRCGSSLFRRRWTSIIPMKPQAILTWWRSMHVPRRWLMPCRTVLVLAASTPVSCCVSGNDCSVTIKPALPDTLLARVIHRTSWKIMHSCSLCAGVYQNTLCTTLAL